jgi:hypothetical protein
MLLCGKCAKVICFGEMAVWITNLVKIMLFARMAFPFGAGYPLQSPDEKSGGFPLLSLTRKGSWRFIYSFFIIVN